MFECPHLRGSVEFTPERERHVARRHPDLLPPERGRIGEALVAPDHVWPSRRNPSVLLFARWYNDLRGGKYVVVVVASDRSRPTRHWIVTAYIARRLGRM